MIAMDDLFCLSFNLTFSTGHLKWNPARSTTIFHRPGYYTEQEAKTLLLNTLWFKYGPEILEYADAHNDEVIPND